MFSIIYEIMLRLVSLTAGCFYPAFVSHKLLKAQKQGAEDDEINVKMNIWLTYWVVYGVWSMFEFLTMNLGTFIPFLNEGKLIFTCWLLPSIGAGSQMIYDEILQFFFSNNEVTIEHALIHAFHAALNLLDRLLRTYLSRIMRIVDDYLLTQGLPQAPAVPIQQPSTDEYFDKLQMEWTPKEAEDLVNTIERVMGEETARDDDNLAVLDKSESEELVFSDCHTKPKVLPKPKRSPRAAGSEETLETQTVLHPNQIGTLTKEPEKEE